MAAPNRLACVASFILLARLDNCYLLSGVVFQKTLNMEKKYPPVPLYYLELAKLNRNSTIHIHYTYSIYFYKNKTCVYRCSITLSVMFCIMLKRVYSGVRHVALTTIYSVTSIMDSTNARRLSVGRCSENCRPAGTGQKLIWLRVLCFSVMYEYHFEYNKYSYIYGTGTAYICLRLCMYIHTHPIGNREQNIRIIHQHPGNHIRFPKLALFLEGFCYSILHVSSGGLFVLPSM